VLDTVGGAASSTPLRAAPAIRWTRATPRPWEGSEPGLISEGDQVIRNVAAWPATGRTTRPVCEHAGSRS